jgi:ATP-dependent protease Clp ATPase subunit
MPPYRSNRAGPVRIDPKPFPVPVDPASLLFTDRAVRQIAKIAFERGTGARGLRSVIEEVLEGVLFDVEVGIRYIVKEKTVRGGEAVKQRVEQMRAPLSYYTLRRF